MYKLAEKNSDFVILSFTKKNRQNRNLIYVDCEKKFQLFSYILEGFIGLDMEGLSDSEVLKLSGLANSYELKKIFSDKEWVLTNLEKIPLLLDGQNADLALNLNDIDKEMVHKTSQDNVMISNIVLEYLTNLDLDVDNKIWR